MTEVFKSWPIELRLGRWQDVLADVKVCDAVITDPPYSERTHSGQRTGTRPRGGGGRKTTLTYTSLGKSDCLDLAAINASWSIIFSDHLAQRWHEAALSDAGLYVFAPLVWARTDATPRLSGDGPTCAVEWITVARPRRRLAKGRSGSRPGVYSGPCDHVGHPGAKPLWLMRALIRDYTLPHDLILDPYAGSGTTLLAAAIEGRRCIGAEMDPETYAKAVKRLEAGWTPDLFGY